MILPGVLRRQVDDGSAIAELWNHAEETHVEVPHEHVDVVRLAEIITTSPKLSTCSLPFPPVREFVVHVHGHDANLFAEVADALVQHDFRHHASTDACSRLAFV